MIVYLDNSSTTKQYDEVTKLMVDMMHGDFGNPSSLHRMGISAENSIKEARGLVSASINASSEEIYFTGSGTEADNLAVFGVFDAKKRRGNRIITSKAEHPAVMMACKRLESRGADVVYVNIDRQGRISYEELKENINDSTILVSTMLVNNELGTVTDPCKIRSLLGESKETVFHADAIQAYGKIPIDMSKLNIDLLSISAHKIHGPKGVGALYVRKGTRIDSHICGGGQEGGLRSGTENTPGIAGFGKAASMMSSSFQERIESIKKCRTYLLDGIEAEIADVNVNSPRDTYNSSVLHKADNDLVLSSPGILNISFLGCPGEVLLRILEQKGIFVSTAAACSSRNGRSKVLIAAGLSVPIIDSAIRFSFNGFNTIEEMDYTLAELKKAVKSMRRLTKPNKT
jgi:cysteine desulfurase